MACETLLGLQISQYSKVRNHFQYHHALPHRHFRLSSVLDDVVLGDGPRGVEVMYVFFCQARLLPHIWHTDRRLS